MSVYGHGQNETWKVVYYPKVMNAGMRGVALIEAPDRSSAIYTFQQQYAGEYSTIDTCTKLFE
jgi:hypothetical protein